MCYFELIVILEKLSFPVVFNEWYQVNVTVAMTDIAITLNGYSVLSFSQYNFFAGSFGFGASPFHAAYYKNITASTSEGTTIYQSMLNDKSIFDDFFVGTNPLPVVVDGARRDRISYAGCFTHLFLVN